ncbi:RNA polymerase sigma factor [Chitinophagaceae bacterium LWZ2-11]
MSAQTPHIETDLLLQIIKGDTEAYTEVYELYKDKIYAFAFTLTKSKDIAEEIVQDVFLKLWEKRTQIDADKSFTEYIKKITYHQVIDFFRKVKRDRGLQQKLEKNIQALRNANEDELIGKELHILYKKAIEQLPPQKKKVYLLGREGVLKYEEIAAEMGLSKNTVKNHMSEAIQLIRQYISTHYIDCIMALLAGHIILR